MKSRRGEMAPKKCKQIAYTIKTINGDLPIQCSHVAKSNGYCWQHDPDYKSPSDLLKEAQAEIASLKARIAEMEEEK